MSAIKVDAARECELSEGYAAFELEFAQHPERFVGLELDGEALEPSDGDEWLTFEARSSLEQI